jgi:signal transduction histidine kinase
MLREIETLDPAFLKKLEKENPVSLPHQFINVYNSLNELLYSSETEKIVDVDHQLLNSIRTEKNFKVQKGDYQIVAFPYQDPEEEEVVIVAGAIDTHGLHAMDNLREIIVTTFAFSLLVVSVIAWLYAGRVLRPIAHIVAEVDRITEANLNLRVDEGNKKDELGRLAQTFNRMLSRLEAAFISQKNFIANASHELKTPFTVMAGEIEVTLMQVREKEYYVGILTSVLNSIKRFNKLSTQLLQLAQASSQRQDRSFQLLRLDDILWEAKDELLKAHNGYEIDILFDMKLDHQSLSLKGDQDLLKVVVLNLMDNGCKYSDNDKVRVTLTVERKDYVTLEFLNNGAGIEQPEIQNIFEPFYRGKNNKKIKGFGIGLSLVEKIVKLHDGKLYVESIPGTMTRFVVQLPTA